MLKVKNLTKKFGEFAAINNVSFSLEKGEIKAIIGPNAAGKTTLLRVLSGQYRADGGRIIFKGIDITKYPQQKFVDMGISRVFQIPALFPNLTVFNNLKIAGKAKSENIRKAPYSSDENRLERECVKVLERMGLLSKKDYTAGNLSHGERRKLEFGMSIIQNPDLLICDEVTAGLSPTETNIVKEVLADMAKRHCSVLTIEHKLEFVFDVARKIIVLNQGRIIAEGSPNEIKGDKEVEKVLLG